MEQLTRVHIEIQLITTAQTKYLRANFTDPTGAANYLRKLADDMEKMSAAHRI